jgi:hypothetical protein
MSSCRCASPRSSRTSAPTGEPSCGSGAGELDLPARHRFPFGCSAARQAARELLTFMPEKGSPRRLARKGCGGELLDLVTARHRAVGVGSGHGATVSLHLGPGRVRPKRLLMFTTCYPIRTGCHHPVHSPVDSWRRCFGPGRSLGRVPDDGRLGGRGGRLPGEVGPEREACYRPERGEPPPASRTSLSHWRLPAAPGIPRVPARSWPAHTPATHR